MMRLAFGLGAAVLAGVVGTSLSAVSACGSSCTDIGCTEAVTVTPEHALGDSGSYEVDFVADGVDMSCTLKVPSTAPAKCTDSRAYVFQEAGRGITFVSVDGKYKSLHVTVLHEGNTIADQTYAVTYQGVEINGHGCGTCDAASETLKVVEASGDGGTPHDAGN
ncbi:MAG TPA: hypothetical protein VH062_19205 [Polyangiaceae bacterium]|jgi:hypothetical protein|nr:hypothetical protein [Polyangiaceae bacterium]